MSKGPIPNSYWVVPGRLAAGEYPGATDADKARATIRGLLAAGIRRFLDLTEEGELLPYAGILKDGAAQLGLGVHWQRLPIPDVSVPSPARMAEIQAAISDALGRGEPLYVHCWGGVGRTGTVVGCCLVESGLSGRDALQRLGELWQHVEKRHRKPRSPETTEQEQFILSWVPTVRSSCRAAPAADRYAGCLLGGAIGDALGAPVEFMSTDDIQAQYGPGGIADFAPAYGHIGAITDDTQMTLWTAEGLLRGHCRGTQRGIGYLPGVVHHAYLRWLKTQGLASKDDAFAYATRRDNNGWLMKVKALRACRAPGNTCLSALESAGIGTMEHPKNNSKGCGGVMRVAPVGLYEQNPDRAFSLGCEVAAITHGHPAGYLAAGCFAATIAAITQGDSLRGAVSAAMQVLADRPHHQETTACLRNALALAASGSAPSPAVVEQVGAGWTAEEALAIALYCAVVSRDDFRRAVLLAVNHSGDSDSTGAICGNILGAALGIDAVPAEWLERVELRRETEALSRDLHTRYRADDEWRESYPGS